MEQFGFSTPASSSLGERKPRRFGKYCWRCSRPTDTLGRSCVFDIVVAPNAYPVSFSFLSKITSRVNSIWQNCIGLVVQQSSQCLLTDSRYNRRAPRRCEGAAVLGSEVNSRAFLGRISWEKETQETTSTALVVLCLLFANNAAPTSSYCRRHGGEAESGRRDATSRHNCCKCRALPIKGRQFLSSRLSAIVPCLVFPSPRLFRPKTDRPSQHSSAMIFQPRIRSSSDVPGRGSIRTHAPRLHIPDDGPLPFLPSVLLFLSMLLHSLRCRNHG